MRARWAGPSLGMAALVVGAAQAPAQTAGVIYATDAPYNVICDYNFATKTGTDNTAGIAAAIAAAQTASSQGAGARLVFPSGACKSGPQTITGQINLVGQGGFATVFVLKSASTAPMFTVQTTGYNFPSDGHPQGQMRFADFRITSEDGRGANATYPGAAGFSFPSGNAWSYWASLDDIMIYNVPGDGIKGSSGNAAVFMRRPYIKSVGGVGISTNSTNDWVIDGANVAGSQGSANVLSSGDSSLYYHNLNSYSAAGCGVTLYGKESVTLDGHGEINLNGKGGLCLSTLTSDTIVSVADVYFGSNSRATVNAWSDILANGGAGTVRLARVLFDSPYSVNHSLSSLYNVQYAVGATVAMTCADCVFRDGSWYSPQTTNDTSHFVGTGATTGNLSPGPYTVATLPSDAFPGAVATVSDAWMCPTYGSGVIGGGSTFCTVMFSGGAWVGQ